MIHCNYLGRIVERFRFCVLVSHGVDSIFIQRHTEDSIRLGGARIGKWGEFKLIELPETTIDNLAVILIQTQRRQGNEGLFMGLPYFCMDNQLHLGISGILFNLKPAVFDIFKEN